jgi:hypothetical protein
MTKIVPNGPKLLFCEAYISLLPVYFSIIQLVECIRTFRATILVVHIVLKKITRRAEKTPISSFGWIDDASIYFDFKFC